MEIIEDTLAIGVNFSSNEKIYDDVVSTLIVNSGIANSHIVINSIDTVESISTTIISGEEL